MTDYYIIHSACRYVDKRTFFQKVTQGIHETYKDISNRCHKIIRKAEKQFGGNFIVADLTYLETTNQTHLIEGV